MNETFAKKLIVDEIRNIANNFIGKSSNKTTIYCLESAIKNLMQDLVYRDIIRGDKQPEFEIKCNGCEVNILPKNDFAKEIFGYMFITEEPPNSIKYIEEDDEDVI